MSSNNPSHRRDNSLYVLIKVYYVLHLIMNNNIFLYFILNVY